MQRRQLLAAGWLVGLPGCLGDDAPAESPTASPTQAYGLGTIEYTVTNEADEASRVEVAIEDGEGRVVQQTTEPELPPGQRVESGSAGHGPDQGPYTVTVRTPSSAAAYEWDVRECARIDLQITITGDGEITIERELCQN